MSAQNPLKKGLGFSLKKDEMTYSTRNPANKEKNLFVIPDVVHLWITVDDKEFLMKETFIIRILLDSSWSRAQKSV